MTFCTADPEATQPFLDVRISYPQKHSSLFSFILASKGVHNNQGLLFYRDLFHEQDIPFSWKQTLSHTNVDGVEPVQLRVFGFVPEID